MSFWKCSSSIFPHNPPADDRLSTHPALLFQMQALSLSRTLLHPEVECRIPISGHHLRCQIMKAVRSWSISAHGSPDPGSVHKLP